MPVPLRPIRMGAKYSTYSMLWKRPNPQAPLAHRDRGRSLPFR
jgi:hypothetical protein